MPSYHTWGNQAFLDHVVQFRFAVRGLNNFEFCRHLFSVYVPSESKLKPDCEQILDLVINCIILCPDSLRPEWEIGHNLSPASVADPPSIDGYTDWFMIENSLLLPSLIHVVGVFYVTTTTVVFSSCSTSPASSSFIGLVLFSCVNAPSSNFVLTLHWLNIPCLFGNNVDAHVLSLFDTSV